MELLFAPPVLKFLPRFAVYTFIFPSLCIFQHGTWCKKETKYYIYFWASEDRCRHPEWVLADLLDAWEIKVNRLYGVFLRQKSWSSDIVETRVHLISLLFCVRDRNDCITYLMHVDLELVTGVSLSHSGFPRARVQEEALWSLIWMNWDVKHLMTELICFMVGKWLQQDISTNWCWLELDLLLESGWFNIMHLDQMRTGTDPFVGPLLWYTGYITSEVFLGGVERNCL